MAVKGVTYTSGSYGSAVSVGSVRYGQTVIVNQWEKGILFSNGKLVKVFDQGAYRIWRSRAKVFKTDTRVWVMTLPSQEILTNDRIAIKITAAAQVHVVDAVKYATAVRFPDQALYLLIQLALREFIVTMSLDELLSSRVTIGSELISRIEGVDKLGVIIDNLDIKDIALPGELKKAQMAIFTAKAQGLAALERARGEISELRALSNAARMVAENPALMQLRLIHHLETSNDHTLVVNIPPIESSQISRQN